MQLAHKVAWRWRHASYASQASKNKLAFQDSPSLASRAPAQDAAPEPSAGGRAAGAQNVDTSPYFKWENADREYDSEAMQEDVLGTIAATGGLGMGSPEPSVS